MGVFSTAAGRGAKLVALLGGSWLLQGLAFPLVCVHKGKTCRRQNHHHSPVLRSPSAFSTVKVAKPFNYSAKLNTTAKKSSSLSTRGF